MIVHFIGTRAAQEKYQELKDLIWKSSRDVETHVFEPCLYEGTRNLWARAIAKKVLREMRRGITHHDIMIVLDDLSSPVIPHWVLAYLGAGMYRLAVPRRFKPTDGSDIRDGIFYYDKFETIDELFDFFTGTRYALELGTEN